MHLGEFSRRILSANYVLAYRVELVGAAHAAVGEHERARLEHPLAAGIAHLVGPS